MKKSKIAALLGMCFFAGLFLIGLSDPPIYYLFVFVGILVSSIATFHYWKAERRNDAKASTIGIWIILVILFAFVLLCLLPALT